MGARNAVARAARASTASLIPVAWARWSIAVYVPGADYTAVNRVLALVIFQEWYEMYLA